MSFHSDAVGSNNFDAKRLAHLLDMDRSTSSQRSSSNASIIPSKKAARTIVTSTSAHRLSALPPETSKPSYATNNSNPAASVKKRNQFDPIKSKIPSSTLDSNDDKLSYKYLEDEASRIVSYSSVGNNVHDEARSDDKVQHPFQSCKPVLTNLANSIKRRQEDLHEISSMNAPMNNKNAQEVNLPLTQKMHQMQKKIQDLDTITSLSPTDTIKSSKGNSSISSHIPSASLHELAKLAQRHFITDPFNSISSSTYVTPDKSTSHDSPNHHLNSKFESLLRTIHQEKSSWFLFPWQNNTSSHSANPPAQLMETMSEISSNESGSLFQPASVIHVHDTTPLMLQPSSTQPSCSHNVKMEMQKMRKPPKSKQNQSPHMEFLQYLSLFSKEEEGTTTCDISQLRQHSVVPRFPSQMLTPSLELVSPLIKSRPTNVDLSHLVQPKKPVMNKSGSSKKSSFSFRRKLWLFILLSMLCICFYGKLYISSGVTTPLNPKSSFLNITGTPFLQTDIIQRKAKALLSSSQSIPSHFSKNLPVLSHAMYSIIYNDFSMEVYDVLSASLIQPVVGEWNKVNITGSYEYEVIVKFLGARSTEIWTANLRLYESMYSNMEVRNISNSSSDESNEMNDGNNSIFPFWKSFHRKSFLSKTDIYTNVEAGKISMHKIKTDPSTNYRLSDIQCVTRPKNPLVKITREDNYKSFRYSPRISLLDDRFKEMNSFQDDQNKNEIEHPLIIHTNSHDEPGFDTPLSDIVIDFWRGRKQDTSTYRKPKRNNTSKKRFARNNNRFWDKDFLILNWD